MTIVVIIHRYGYNELERTDTAQKYKRKKKNEENNYI